jgi:hypothetical protein
MAAEEARVLMKPQAIPAINKTMTYGTPVAIVSILRRKSRITDVSWRSFSLTGKKKNRQNRAFLETSVGAKRSYRNENRRIERIIEQEFERIEDRSRATTIATTESLFIR